MSAQNTAWPVVELSPARWATFPPSVEAGLAGLGAAAGLQQLRAFLLSLPGHRPVHSIEAGPGLDPSIR